MIRRLCYFTSLSLLFMLSASAIADPIAVEIQSEEIAFGPDRASRADTLFYFAPDGQGSYGSSGTNERGFDFNGYGECSHAGWWLNGLYVALRENDFIEGENQSCVWTFFDPETTEPGYEMGVYPYGPPYLTMSVESPPLERDAEGAMMDFGPDDGLVLLRYDIYLDLPLNALIFYGLEIRARAVDGGYSGWFDPFGNVYYGEQGWVTLDIDLSDHLFGLIGGPENRLGGIQVRLIAMDMCNYWCDVFGSGEPHTLGPVFDNVQLYIVLNETGVDEQTPARTASLRLHPNPFNPGTTIEFVMAETEHAELAIYDLGGRRVRTLLNDKLSAGERSIFWNGRDDKDTPLASGVYLVRLETAEHSETSRAVLLK